MFTQTELLTPIPTPNGNKHCDDWELNEYFYQHYWPDLTATKTPIRFSGETILSFKTSGGALIRALENYLWGKGEPVHSPMPAYHDDRIRRVSQLFENHPTHFHNHTEEIAQLLAHMTIFRQRTHCLANFMPLPILSSPSLNQTKGKAPYHDFPDLFFKEIQRYYTQHNHSDPQCAWEQNQSYFDLFANFDAFVETNYLKAYTEVQIAPDSQSIFWKLLRRPVNVIITDKNLNATLTQFNALFQLASATIEARASQLNEA
ncbi:hypothetical protein HMPREF0044_0014 [Gleimia coleocanis DSM 15436]|uniref:Uncharacterized protein n=1 Tax=Gleimia coleocanis DSM 15436 TaxID=525245 RepID=C0VXX4_9ACTO|nr:hypothetical protein [Gleimia coleocanis]EEH64277.1 hypothetical protein HMPREF0044_0014 [Gleimia coleocanis DSM 15436]